MRGAPAQPLLMLHVQPLQVLQRHLQSKGMEMNKPVPGSSVTPSSPPHTVEGPLTSLLQRLTGRNRSCSRPAVVDCLKTVIRTKATTPQAPLNTLRALPRSPRPAGGGGGASCRCRGRRAGR